MGVGVVGGDDEDEGEDAAEGVGAVFFFLSFLGFLCLKQLKMREEEKRRERRFSPPGEGEGRGGEGAARKAKSALDARCMPIGRLTVTAPQEKTQREGSRQGLKPALTKTHFLQRYLLNIYEKGTFVKFGESLPNNLPLAF